MSGMATDRRLMVSTVDYHTAGEPFRIVRLERIQIRGDEACQAAAITRRGPVRGIRRVRDSRCKP